MQSLFKHKKGVIRLSGNTAQVAAIGLISLVILLQLFAALLPNAQNASQDVADTGAPLSGTIFGNNGIIILLLVASLIFIVMGGTGFGSGRRR